MLKRLLLIVLYMYGKAGAMGPSHHGFYEPEVPQCLIIDYQNSK